MHSLFFQVFRQLNRVTGKDISFHLVEISPFLARTQAQTLCGPTSSLGLSNLTFNRSLRDIDPTREGSGGNTFYHQGITSETDVPVYWYRDLASLPRGFHFYIAHEFFDALPVHKLQVSIMKISFDTEASFEHQYRQKMDSNL
jgi:NADH dehydrogenase [ubiquinone] 1 alpha subcomplex assembly factor 7